MKHKKFIFDVQKNELTSLGFLETHKLTLYIVIITLLALYIRWNIAGFISGDTVKYFIPWLEHLDQNGGIFGIPTLDSDYPVAYQYLLSFLTTLPLSSLSRIKMMGLFFDLGNALVVMAILRNLGEYNRADAVPWIGYALALFIPPVVFNTAFWGQCDNIYTFFILLSIFSLLTRRYPLAFLAFGFSISFKLQAIFFLPFLIFFYLKSKRISLVNFILVPMVYSALYIPALLVGKPLSQFLQAYGMQVNEYSRMTLGLANFWVLFPDDFPQLQTPALILTAALMLSLMFYLWQQESFHLTPKQYVPLVMLTIMLVAYFLPAMHERYMFPVDVLAVIYLLIFPKRWYLPIGIWLINLNGYLPVLWQFEPALSPPLLSLVYLALMVVLLDDLLNEPKPGIKTSTLTF